MASSYGDSVKFYEKMAELHSQLKSYEEEQYHLQEEFTRLWPNSPRNRDPPLLQHVSETQSEKVLNTDLSPSKLIQPMSVDNVSEDERRRKRNQTIMNKIKDLEANAAVFAARSEKLRIMRSEYEVLVKKYMDNRRLNPVITNTLLPAINTNHSAPTEKFATDSPKYNISVGVNTEITGPVKPLEVTSKFNYFELAETQSHHGTPVHLDNSGQNGTLNYLELLPSQNDRPKEPENNTKFQKGPDVSAQTQNIKDKQDYLNDYFSIKPQNNSNPNPDNVDNFPDLNRFRSQVTTETNLDTEDSMAEKNRYHHHNAYFDMSTTSESDVTSTQNILQKKKVPMVPINISLDDSTQSDTFSLSMSVHVPHEPKSTVKANLNSAVILSTVLTTDGSDSTASFQNRRGSIQSLQRSINQQVVNTAISLVQKENENLCLDPSKDEIGENLKDFIDEKFENDSQSSLSDSLTTSPNDSVMDSVQNRTLNESLPHDNRSKVEELDVQENEYNELLNPFQIPIPSFNIPKKEMAGKIKEMSQYEAKEENERKSMSTKDTEKFRLEKEPLPYNFEEVSAETTALNSVSSKLYAGGGSSSHISPLDLNQGTQETAKISTPTVPVSISSSMNQEESLSKFDLKKPMSPLDVLNNFKEIEEEFAGRNAIVNEGAAPSWEKNTIQTNNSSDSQGHAGKNEKERHNLQIEKKVSEAQKEIVAANSFPVPEQPSPEKDSQITASSRASSNPDGNSLRPKVSTGVVAGTGPRRVKLKLDYEDSDSDAEPVPLRTLTTSKGNSFVPTVNTEQTKDNLNELDDDFDDFFDI